MNMLCLLNSSDAPKDPPAREALQDLVRSLVGPDPGQRRRALETVRVLTPGAQRSVVIDLIDVVSRGHPTTGVRAGEALVAIGPPAAPVLVDALIFGGRPARLLRFAAVLGHVAPAVPPEGRRRLIPMLEFVIYTTPDDRVARALMRVMAPLIAAEKRAARAAAAQGGGPK